MVEILYLYISLLFSMWLIIIRGTLPRYRIDQLQINIWKDWIFSLLFYFSLLLIISLIYF